MSTLAPLPSLPAVSSSTGTDYSGLSESEIDDKLNSPVSDAEENQAMGYNVAASAPTAATPATSPSAAQAPTAPGAATATGSSTGLLSSLWATITGNVENGIFVILGLLLIAAGIFAFKTSQTIVQVAGKAASKGAEIGAAAAA